MTTLALALLATIGQADSERTGRVLFADGSPGAGAELYFPTFEDRIYVRADRVDNAEVRRTAGPNGRFPVPPLEEDYHVLSLGPAGFGHATREQFEKDLTLTVRPWAKVEGVFRLAGLPHGPQDLSIHFEDGPQSLYGRQAPFYFDFDATTDADGRFLIERMPPGRFLIGETVVTRETENGSTHTMRHPQKATAVAGETLRLDFPPAGTLLTGRVLVPEGVDARTGFSRLNRTVIDGYPFRVEKDGTFLIPDVPPGEYTLRWHIELPPYDDFGNSESEGTLTKDVPVVVKEGAATLDLGTTDLR